MSASIFISFASKDVKVATTLCTALESRGFACWISARDIQPGENFQVSIVQALRRAKIMLLVFTANSNTSEEMTKELALASQQKLIVIPLRIEDVAPNDAFAYEFATRQWIDVFSDWESSIDQLCRRIGRALEGHPVEAPAAAVPAPAPVPVITPSKPRAAKPAVASAAPVAAAPIEEPEPLIAPEETFDPYSTSLPVLANDDTEAEDAPDGEDDARDAPARRSPGLVRAALLAAGVAALAVIGLATPKLLSAKHEPAAPVAAAPPAPVEAPLEAAAAPVLLAAQAVLVEDEKPAARPKRKAVSREREAVAKKDQSNDIPF